MGPALPTFPDCPCARVCLDEFSPRPLCMSPPSASLLPPLVRVRQAMTPVCCVDTNNERQIQGERKSTGFSPSPTEQSTLCRSRETSAAVPSSFHELCKWV